MLGKPSDRRLDLLEQTKGEGWRRRRNDGRMKRRRKNASTKDMLLMERVLTQHLVNPAWKGEEDEEEEEGAGDEQDEEEMGGRGGGVGRREGWGRRRWRRRRESSIKAFAGRSFWESLGRFLGPSWGPLGGPGAILAIFWRLSWSHLAREGRREIPFPRGRLVAPEMNWIFLEAFKRLNFFVRATGGS